MTDSKTKIVRTKRDSQESDKMDVTFRDAYRRQLGPYGCVDFDDRVHFEVNQVALTDFPDVNLEWDEQDIKKCPSTTGSLNRRVIDYLINRDFIVTHDGEFHADEVFACWALMHTKDCENLPVVRSRSKAVVGRASVRVDIGGEYDGASAFDHHQAGCHVKYKGRAPDCSSAGLVWLKYGAEVIGRLTDLKRLKDRQTVADLVYDLLISEIDAVDNGQMSFKGNVVKTGISSRIDKLNRLKPNVSQSLKFQVAMEYMAKEVSLVLCDIAHCCEESFRFNELMACSQEHCSGRILVLSERLKWSEFIHSWEDANKHCPVQFVIFPNVDGVGYKVQAVPVEPGSYDNRRLHFKSLRGKDIANGDTLPPGVKFVHKNGYMAGVDTIENGIALATAAVLDDTDEVGV